MSVSDPGSSSCNSIFKLFIHSAFLLFTLDSHILLQIFLLPLHLFVGFNTSVSLWSFTRVLLIASLPIVVIIIRKEKLQENK